MTSSMTILSYSSASGPIVSDGSQYFLVADFSWDELIHERDLAGILQDTIATRPAVTKPQAWLAPISLQEVWAAGVTYLRSREARIGESRGSGSATFYDRVYDAPRPELFFKAAARHVAAPGTTLRLRRDSHWVVPEPELTVLINRRHEIVGYTIGNDLTCRDIESENPLYLAQAKTFNHCASLGPAVLIQSESLPKSTEIRLRVHRRGQIVVELSTTLAQLKRQPAELVDYLTREMDFPQGCYLMTGTGIVPPDEFSLRIDDRVTVTIEPIGQLENPIA